MAVRVGGKGEGGTPRQPVNHRSTVGIDQDLAISPLTPAAVWSAASHPPSQGEGEDQGRHVSLLLTQLNRRSFPLHFHIIIGHQHDPWDFL